MRTYDVLITPDAYEDLAGIRDHIAHGLGSPEDARSALHSIRKTVGSLATMPSRTKEVEIRTYLQGLSRSLDAGYIPASDARRPYAVAYTISISGRV